VAKPRLPAPSHDLTADEVFFGLVDYGLFPEKIPPCFITKGLSSKLSKKILSILDENKLKDALNKRSHDYIRYEALRDINIPRHMGIPHPESYVVQALAIRKHWSELQAHYAKPSPRISQIFARYIDGKKIFEMNYKGTDRFDVEEAEMQLRFGAQFVVHTDISACFPSIYTHSVPWAMMGRETAKSNTKLRSTGNLLDKCTQITRDNQTNGILIGPHASNIISEIILTRVDHELIQSGLTCMTRHIDDYRFYAKTHEEAERFLHCLGLALREYELTINERKTKILPMPQACMDDWVRELNTFQFPNEGGEIRFDTVRRFLDLALHLAQNAGTSAALNYAIKMIPGRLNDRAKRLYVQEAINLALTYPYLAPLLYEHVFRKHNYTGIEKAISSFANELLYVGLQKIYPDAIAHSLFYAIVYDLTLSKSKDRLTDVLRMDDCVCSVLLLRYAKRKKLRKLLSDIRKHANSLKGLPRREQDRQWLLIYSVWSEADLHGNGQAFLAELKKARFLFVRKRP